jgi:hypothetical protein
MAIFSSCCQHEAMYINRRGLETPWRIMFLKRSKIAVIEMTHKVIIIRAAETRIENFL